MAEIPEDLLRRSAEAKARALGLPVEQVLAEMKGEPVPESAAAPTEETTSEEPVTTDSAPEETATEEMPAAAVPDTAASAVDAEEPDAEEPDVEEPDAGEPVADETPAGPAASDAPGDAPAADEPAPAAETPAVEPAVEAPATAVAVAEPETEETDPGSNGAGGSNGSNGARRAAVVSPRPVAPPVGTPEGVRTQRLLTVVKARAIQNVKAEPQDKVNTWPHLMIAEFTSLMAMTAFLLVLSVILQAPLLEPANFNATPNPSKAPWYFLGLQELLSYFDPQVAGVTVPTIVGLIGFMMIPYVDRNPSTKPSDRKFAIMLYTIFLAGSAALSIIGVLFRGRGFNFSYPWRDGIFFDDLKDWVNFE